MMKIATKNLNRISKNLKPAIPSSTRRKGSLGDEGGRGEKNEKMTMSPLRKGPMSHLMAIPDTASSLYEDDFDRYYY